MELEELNIYDCLSENDKTNISKYIPFLQCPECHKFSLNFLYCSECLKSTCEKCTCQHLELTRPRHLNYLIENIKLKCKYKCSENSFSLSEIYEHIKNCKFKDKYFKNYPEEKIVLKETFKYNEFNKKELNKLLLKNILLNEKEKINNNLKCFNCDLNFDSNINYINHFNECLKNNEKNNKELKIKNFENYFKIYLENLGKNYYDKFLIRSNETIKKIKKMNFDLSESFKNLNDKQNELISLQTSNNLSKKKIFEEIDKNEHIKSLLEEKNKLYLEQQNQLNIYNEKNSHLNNLINKTQEELKNKNKKIIEQILEISNQNNFINNYFSHSLLLNNKKVFEGKCSKCEKENNEKFYCNNCNKKYCTNSCSKKCKKENCLNFICPICNEECKLCLKKQYCKNCMIKCFSKFCKNSFCPECYNLNKHQIPLDEPENQHCDFAICDDGENKKVCILTTSFCLKCERRLCNKCLKNNPIHQKHIINDNNNENNNNII